MSEHDTIREGAVVGVIGAVAVAVWFLVIDLFLGQPLFTPVRLGTALFEGLEVAGRSLQGDLALAAAYTVFHFAAFFVVGLLAVYSTHLSLRQPVFLALFLVLFVSFEVGFYGMVAVLNETRLLEDLAWYQIGLGNLFATGLMASYLWVRHPTIGPSIDRALSGREI